MQPVAVVLAAGLGKRMRSQTAKVLHPLAGIPMVLHVVNVLKAVGCDRILVVVGHQADRVTAHLADSGVQIVLQPEPLGTGHALLQAHPLLARYEGTLLVLCGDTPLIRPERLDHLLEVHTQRSAGISVMTARLENPSGYGRIVRNRAGSVVRIVEEKDAGSRERRIREVNTGIYAFRAPRVFDLLSRIRPDNRQGEYYLTDVVREAIRRKMNVRAVEADDVQEVMGINSRLELAEAERLLQRRIGEKWMANGVTLISPESTFIGAEVTIDPDTVIHPHAVLEGKTVIGEGCVIRASRIVDSRLEPQVTVRDYCVIEGAWIGSRVSVGPSAHLRPGTVLRPGAKVGNFVEVKASELGEGSKANHLSYIGDATVGREVNIGAGTITCNYDGVQKHRTVIGDRVFVGSDVQFVAPVQIGEGAVIAAGSTITEDVPKEALALARARQVVKTGWAKKRREKAKKR